MSADPLYPMTAERYRALSEFWNAYRLHQAAIAGGDLNKIEQARRELSRADATVVLNSGMYARSGEYRTPPATER